MPTFKLPPKPSAAEPVVDPQTGKMNRLWDVWFQAVERALREQGY